MCFCFERPALTTEKGVIGWLRFRMSIYEDCSSLSGIFQITIPFEACPAQINWNLDIQMKMY